VQLGLIDLHEELPQPKVGAPIQRAGIVAETVPAVIGELHSRAAHAGTMLGPHGAGQVAAAQQRHLFECLQKFAIE
jgi:hypothetical protein